MRRWVVLGAFLFMSLFVKAPVTVNPMTEVNKKWNSLYPKWNSFTMTQQEDRIRIYRLSPNKHLWFPDSFPVKPYNSAPIYPRNYLSDRIKYLREK